MLGALCSFCSHIIGVYYVQQKRGFFSRSFSTWGVSLGNGPYTKTYRPMDLVAIKKRHQEELEARAAREGVGAY